MDNKLIGDTVDIAVIGMTNSGKSTFISSLFDRKEVTVAGFNLEALRNNTKMTVHYELVREIEIPFKSEQDFDKLKPEPQAKIQGIEFNYGGY